MAQSILKNKNKFVGKPIQDIHAEFGRHDGFYFSDWIPAYIIQDAKKKGDDVWQIVFTPDKHKKVSDIIVHKNCCD